MSQFLGCECEDHGISPTMFAHLDCANGHFGCFPASGWADAPLTKAASDSDRDTTAWNPKEQPSDGFLDICIFHEPQKRDATLKIVRFLTFAMNHYVKFI